jgi:hypothetical protein
MRLAPPSPWSSLNSEAGLADATLETPVETELVVLVLDGDELGLDAGTESPSEFARVGLIPPGVTWLDLVTGQERLTEHVEFVPDVAVIALALGEGGDLDATLA